MPVTQEQFEAIQKELAAYKAKAEELQTKLSEETSKAKFDAYEGQLNEKTTTIKNLEASLASAKEDIGSVSAKLNEIVALYEAANTQLKDAESQNLQLSEKVKAFELERTVARRSSMLSDVGVDDVENTVAELSGLDDESFEKVIATIKKSKGKMYEDKTKMEEEEKKKKEMMKEKASEDILDDVDKTSSASVSDINTDNSGVATAAEQYFASILKTTQKANKK
jgi:DNA repair exonuclease SbcCD ATPase subunit